MTNDGFTRKLLRAAAREAGRSEAEQRAHMIRQALQRDYCVFVRGEECRVTDVTEDVPDFNALAAEGWDHLTYVGEPHNIWFASPVPTPTLAIVRQPS
ncbi:MAG TPA: hypothetical protein VFB90_01130 [Dehalococcoidia bacterium]|nr:hypothetical protein [Dehalococcoidia bacterium]